MSMIDIMQRLRAELLACSTSVRNALELSMSESETVQLYHVRAAILNASDKAATVIEQHKKALYTASKNQDNTTSPQN